MKLKKIITAAVFAAGVYGIFAFGNWQVNAGKWDLGLRFLCAFLMVWAIFIGYYFDKIDNQ